MLKIFVFVFHYFFKNGQSSAASFSFILGYIKQKFDFTLNKCENDPSSIRCGDSNSRPLDHQSSSITTRPGHPLVARGVSLLFLEKNWPSPASFRLFLSFQTKITIFITNKCEKYIQYTVLGFELTTS